MYAKRTVIYSPEQIYIPNLGVCLDLEVDFDVIACGRAEDVDIELGEIRTLQPIRDDVPEYEFKLLN